MVIDSVLSDAVVCWGGITKKSDAGATGKVCLGKLAPWRALNWRASHQHQTKGHRGKKLLTVMDHDCHPLYETVTIRQKSLIKLAAAGTATQH